MEWNPQKSIEDIDKGGVATAILSISEPNVWFGDNTVARALARECNEHGAKVTADHPGRFGFFAALPLPESMVLSRRSSSRWTRSRRTASA